MQQMSMQQMWSLTVRRWVIRGNELHVNRLTLDKGEVDIDGRIDSFVYSDTAASGEKQESFFARLFR